MTQSCNEKTRGRVLVIDDDVTICLLAKTTLTQAGYDVLEAANSDTALEMFTTFCPDVVLLDIMLPGMDGFQLCAAIRALPEHKDTPVIIMTGLDDSDAIMTAYRVGATDFITKPVSWQALAYRIHYIFRASQAFRDLRQSEERLSQAQRIARMGSWEWQPAEDRIDMSENCRLILGLPSVGYPLSLAVLMSIIHPEDHDQVTRVLEAAKNSIKSVCTEFRVVTNDRSERYMHAEAVAMHESHNQSVRITGTLLDISDRKKTEGQIRFLAYYDSLTGLPNRVLFKEHLNRAITLSCRHKRKLAVLFIDIDRFKGVNDSLGHTIGDLLLQRIAERLHDCIRQTDIICRKGPVRGEFSIARLGGDEFIIMLEDVTTPESTAHVAHRIIESFAIPFQLSTYEVYITCSIGICLFPDDAKETDELIKNADIAMYASKELGRNTFQFYKTEMNAATLQRLIMENQLRGAIERNEFILHYQPQVDSSTGRLVALEALVRWHRPDMGVVSPAEFITIAEESGVICNIDEWVLNSVCSQLKAWQEEGITPIRVAINLSGHHFRRNKLTATVFRALTESGVAPHLLELELTEGVLMQQLSETVATLSALRKMGVNISIDDFGMGYSSLNYLKNFPLSTLKIDGSFVKDIGNGIESAAIIKAIIALAKGLKLEVIAEGVETKEQLDFLNKSGCTIIQGFIYSTPLSLLEVSVLLSEGHIFTVIKDEPIAKPNLTK
ncbi:MAG: EAL domain-containing protein [Geobacteraceae bacterium]